MWARLEHDSTALLYQTPESAPASVDTIHQQQIGWKCIFITVFTTDPFWNIPVALGACLLGDEGLDGQQKLKDYSFYITITLHQPFQDAW